MLRSPHSRLSDASSQSYSLITPESLPAERHSLLMRVWPQSSETLQAQPADLGVRHLFNKVLRIRQAVCGRELPLTWNIMFR
jgi:hypothetical protein